MGILKRNEETLQETRLEKSKIFSETIIANNRRLIVAFLVIFLLANVAVTLIKVLGVGSQYLTYTDIILEFVIASAIITLTILLSRRLKGTIASGYVTIIGVVFSLLVFQYAFSGAPELFAAAYITMALSVFYFNTRITIFTLLLVMATQTAVYLLNPELLPKGATSNTLVRYICFLMVGIGASAGAGATRHLLKLAIDKQNEASGNLGNLRQLAKALMESVSVLKNRSHDQDNITLQMNDISQHQASALEEISASLEELTANSESISKIARSLYEELEITVSSVNDLKSVNDKVQESSVNINNTLTEVTEFSNISASHIQMTKEKFDTVKSKSSDMSAFVQVINDIADQVNLLSLNAAIEAARAGESGRGFAVVADEISKLADATTQNSKEIEKIIKENQSLIDQSNSQISQTAEMMNKLGGAIARIKDEIIAVGNLISDIDVTIKTIRNLNLKIHESSKTIENATAEQKLATDESSQTTADIAKSAQDIVVLSTKIADSTRTISGLSDELNAMTGDMIRE